MPSAARVRSPEGALPEVRLVEVAVDDRAYSDVAPRCRLAVEAKGAYVDPVAQVLRRVLVAVHQVREAPQDQVRVRQHVLVVAVDPDEQRSERNGAVAG